MNLRDAEALLADAVPRRAGVWVDFGAGDGTFSRALARLLGAGSRIYAVDRAPGAIAALERLAATHGVPVIPIAADFTERLELPEIAPAEVDGMLFANALHFVPKPDAVLARLITWLRPGGRVVIVEYDGRKPSRWVPYPIDVPGLGAVAAAAGLSKPRITATRASAYGGIMFVARLDYSPKEAIR